MHVTLVTGGFVLYISGSVCRLCVCVCVCACVCVACSILYHCLAAYGCVYNVYKYKNEVGCRDDTVPKTVDTRRHCEEE